MSIKEIEAARAANAAAITATNEAEAALVLELGSKIELASLLASVLTSAQLQVEGRDVSAYAHEGYWTYRKDLNPTLEHYGFVIQEHEALRHVGVVVRMK